MQYIPAGPWNRCCPLLWEKSILIAIFLKEISVHQGLFCLTYISSINCFSCQCTGCCHFHNLHRGDGLGSCPRSRAQWQVWGLTSFCLQTQLSGPLDITLDGHLGGIVLCACHSVSVIYYCSNFDFWSQPCCFQSRIKTV